MIDEIIQDAEERMGKSIESLNTALKKVRTGRAHPSLLDSVKVDYYGSPTQIGQVANVAVEDGRTLTITPWEKSMTPEIEKAILSSNLGLNPATAGEVIRLPMPALTEETRRELVKTIKADAENAKIALRNIRRDANSDFKDLLKEKDISEDDDRRGQDLVQKLIDTYSAKVDAQIATKETELMEV